MELELLFSLVFLLLVRISGASSGSRNITSMFTLGDSYIDTGNFVIMAAPVIPVWIDKPPYGETFFGRPSGRPSDGRVIIDFIAEELGLPFLPASLANSSDDVSRGVNFAVGGATAIDVGFFERNSLAPFKLLNNSLDVQLAWFEKLRPSLCNTTEDSRGCFSKSLFIVGEFGVNDYNFIWMANKTEGEVRSYVPKVVKTIALAVESSSSSSDRPAELIDDGAAYVVVPGNPPTGCSPTVLTLRRSPDAADYDRVSCLRGVNDVARHHNALLRAAVGGLRARHPRATIIFADFYEPIRKILENSGQFGVVAGDVLKACCGAGGGAYNWNSSAVCGMPGVAACRDPSAYVSWDGLHFTEAVNHYVAKGWLHGPYADPPILRAIHH
ncbi:GDSL esterase/lipase [Panicum miliaceum]|uniref:GDSL esterase/lipase n=1 Tax=Panicum miliaceum TaxID=4540 RepID=A0A3L6R7Y5_PANMI|nr:GDSL esterase/lipase [Panicum miliaceum]